MSVENRTPCRTCLDVECERVSILNDPLVRLYLKSCLSIVISENDELSKYICVSCVSQLRDFYNFQLNAKCSQDWLESAIKTHTKKSENKIQIQPLPDSEYNSDSLLEFLNNTENIEEYLSNLGKEDIPSIINMVDRNNDNSIDFNNKLVMTNSKIVKPLICSKKKPDTVVNEMEIDILDSDLSIVKEILSKESLDISTALKSSQNKMENKLMCFACKSSFGTAHKLIEHLNLCEIANKTCSKCNKIFDSKIKMLEHQSTKCAYQNVKKDMDNNRLNTTKYAPNFFRCKRCGEFFHKYEQIYCHIKRHLIKITQEICDVCGHGFLDDKTLSAHKSNVHATSNDLMYRCKVCQLTSLNKQEIYMHVQKHTDYLEPLRQLCETCGKSFSSQGLLRHLRTHSNKNSIKVETKNVENLTDNGELIVCEYCGDLIDQILYENHRIKCM